MAQVAPLSDAIAFWNAKLAEKNLDLNAKQCIVVYNPKLRGLEKDINKINNSIIIEHARLNNDFMNQVNKIYNGGLNMKDNLERMKKAKNDGFRKDIKNLSEEIDKMNEKVTQFEEINELIEAACKAKVKSKFGKGLKSDIKTIKDSLKGLKVKIKAYAKN